MRKILVSYFSASGRTKAVAEKIARAVGGELFEIEPVQKYTKEDLDWTNKHSRSSVEMNNRNSRPAVKYDVANIEEYSTVILGFPVWWYIAPTIINTFIEENNLAGKKIYVFVTSGGSDCKASFENLKADYPKLKFIASKKFQGNEKEEELKNWIK